MATTDAWPIIHTERKALVADLEPLDAQGWATPSMCAGWSVRDVLGHMVATAKKTPPGFFLGLAASGFRFNSMSAKDIATETAGGVSAPLEHFKALLDATTHPPGPIDAMIGEVIVHGEDIRQPLQIKRVYPVTTLIKVADFYKASNLLLGGKRRVAGLRLVAEDAEWSSGSGPEVHGPMLALALVIAGRRPALEHLSGPGLDALASRT